MATTAETLAQAADQAYTDAQTRADNALTQSGTSLTTAQAAVAGLVHTGAGSIASDAVIAAGQITSPTVVADITTDVQNAFDYAFGSFNSIIQPQIVNYLDAFFPDISATLKSGSDQWLIDTIANGRFVPASVEEAIWNRAKDREAAEAARAESDTIDAAAARGFAIPSGVMNYTVAAMREELTKKTASINREIAIKSFDTANENSKFAIQQAVQLRVSFVAAMGDFIKTAIHMPNSAVDYAKTIMEAKNSLYEKALQLYSAEIDEEKMRTGVMLENRAQNIHAFSASANAFSIGHGLDQGRAKIQADVAMSAADTLAKVAAAALATRNSVVSVSAGV